MSGLRVLLLQKQRVVEEDWTVLMSVNPKMCDLDPLSPLSCLPLVLVLSRSCVSCLVLLLFFFFFFCRACCECDFASVFFYLLVDNAETIFRFFSLFFGLFFFFFFSLGDFGFVVFVFPSGGCFCCPCCSIIEREVRMCGRGKRTGHMNAGKTE